MNFTDINGIWPLIKDYIDSKIGGSSDDKYKHMIYVENFYNPGTTINLGNIGIDGTYGSTINISNFVVSGSLAISVSGVYASSLPISSTRDIPIDFTDNMVIFKYDDKLYVCNSEGKLYSEPEEYEDYNSPGHYLICRPCLKEGFEYTSIPNIKIQGTIYNARNSNGAYTNKIGDLNVDVTNTEARTKLYFVKIKDGWYINYHGQIYDSKGNIVE